MIDNNTPMMEKENWDSQLLSNIARIIPSNVDKKITKSEKLVSLCNYVDVYRNRRITKQIDFMVASATESEITKYSLEEGDLIITKDSEDWREIGVPAYVSEHLCDVLCGYHLALILPENSKVSGHFLLFAFQSAPIIHQFQLSATGVTRYGLTIASIERLIVPIPPLPEQRRIIGVLSTLDEAIEKTEALIAKLEQMKVGLMQDLLTKGIDEHGNVRSEETHEFRDSSLGRIPADWDVKSLSEVVDLRVGYAFKSSWFSEDGVRLLRGQNVGTGVAEWKETRWLSHSVAKRFQEYMLTVGDLIIGMDRTFTQQGYKVSVLTEKDVPCLLVQRVGCFIPMGIPAGFMRILIQSPMYNRQLALQQKGMDIPHLSRNEILSPLIPVPKENAEMDEIAKRIETMYSVLDSNKSHAKKLHSLKSGLMADLLTGRVRVPAGVADEKV